MRTLGLILLMAVMIFASQVKADNWPMQIDTSDPLWAEIGPYLPDSAHDIFAFSHRGVDGKEYVAVQYSYVVEGYESQGLLIGGVGGQWKNFRYGLGGEQQIEDDASDLWFFDKLEFASFATRENQIDFLIVKGGWAAAGGSARGTFLKAFNINEYPSLGPDEEYWNAPDTYGLRDCDFLIIPERNSVIVWIASPLAQTTLGYEPYPVKQYMYVYDELGLDLIRMDTTSELYSTLPSSPPFDW